MTAGVNLVGYVYKRQEVLLIYVLQCTILSVTREHPSTFCLLNESLKPFGKYNIHLK